MNDSDMLQIILDLARSTGDGAVTHFATIRGSGKFAPEIKRWPAFALPSLDFAAQALAKFIKIDRDMRDLEDLLRKANVNFFLEGKIIYWMIDIPKDHPLYSSSSELDDWCVILLPTL